MFQPMFRAILLNSRNVADSLMTPSISAMTLGDVLTIGEIERRNYPVPWTDGIFRDCVKAGYKGMVMRGTKTIVGYAMLQIGYRESHLLNLCIDAQYQGRGYARVFLQHIEKVSIAEGAEMMFLEVRPSNPRARKLYELNGFNEISVRKDYYDTLTGREDAVVMAKALVA